jgi:CysZ protein
LTLRGKQAIPATMPSAFLLALNQMTDPRLLLLLLKSLALSLVAFVLLCALGWYGLQGALAWLVPSFGAEWQQIIAAVLLIIGAVLVWRIVALAVLQFHADEVIEAVEARHYPAHLKAAQVPDWRQELCDGMAAAGRALLANLIALPFAIMLIVTGIGTPLLFWAVNGVLLGRELDDMVWRRHRPSATTPSPLSRSQRLLLGGVISALFIVPFINFLAPFIGAAMATHLHHRKGSLPNAA